MTVDYKLLYLEAEKERKRAEADYLELAKKLNQLVSENSAMRQDIIRLRKLINERKDNS